MGEFFKDILENDEKIIKVVKPSKKRYWRAAAFFAIPLFWPHLIIMMVFSFFTLPYWYAKGYKNLYYAYTNKRLIVRSGIIGVDYASLEYKDLTSSSVNVGFLDKSCNTGTLEFVNPSAHGKPILFQYVEKPYELMKEIKDYISQNGAK